MILKKIEIRNIKSYYPEEIIDFDEKINLFVGPNGGGKSNLFEIIQGIISNILFKHVTLKPNSNRTNITHPHKNLAYVIEQDNIDQTNLIQNLLDKHFTHESEPASVYLILKITSQDISTLNTIKSNKGKILSVLESKVAAAEALIAVLEKISNETEFTSFTNKELRLIVSLPNNSTIQIADYTPFPADQHAALNLLLELTQYLNVLYEISILFPDIELSPLSRYFGPHRQVAQPQSNVPVNLSTLGNLEDNYTKGINITKESAHSLIDGSYIKLSKLNELGKHKVIDSYKKYLQKYLHIVINIKKLEGVKFVCEYEIEYKRESGVPLKLSSGEKEFFNLITGLILSGINNGIVLIDEPELHLHSQWQQAILNLMFDLSSEFNIQFFIVTHSSKFINDKTLPHIFRVYLNGLYSHIIKPRHPAASSELKDLVQFLNSTNNEKIFFTQKVILVEGISDQIIFSDIVQKLKAKLNSDTEVEILPVGSKYNLFKFRQLLNEWEIDNFIIADLDYIKDIRKHRNIIFSREEIKQIIVNLDNNGEINKIVNFSEKKLNEILCKQVSQDSRAIIKLIADKPKLNKAEFLKAFDELSEYIIRERALSINNKAPLSSALISFFDKLSTEEKILILENGEIEDYYFIKSNKIENALETIKTLSVSALDPKIKLFITKIIS